MIKGRFETRLDPFHLNPKTLFPSPFAPARPRMILSLETRSCGFPSPIPTIRNRDTSQEIKQSSYEVSEEHSCATAQGKCIVNSISLKVGEKDFLEHARLLKRCATPHEHPR